MRTIISGGHWDNPTTPWTEDPGCSYAGFTEFDICQKIRNEVLRLIPTAIPVPSNMPLRTKIDFINGFCKSDDLVIEIHLNSNSDVNRRGCEVYYSDNAYLANIFAKHISKELGIPNGGAKHDSTTYVGSLGWLRNIKAQNILIEVCYLSNTEDRMKIVWPSGQQAAARGIIKAIEEHKSNLGTLEALKVILSRLIDLIYGKI